MKIQFKILFLTILASIALFIFFSYRLAETPSGITVDEAASGYNGILLANTLHDQNGRFLPVFVLSIHGTDWRTPYTQYLIALFFKLFGPSVFVMRLTNVMVSIVSTLLLFYLGKLIFGYKGAFITFLAYIITPVVMIQTHLAVDPVLVVPFISLWLIGLFKYKESFSTKYLTLAALALGLGFYSYKGIRPPIAIWSVISLVYIAYLNWPTSKNFIHSFGKVLKPVIIFSATLFPFFAIIPLLEVHYAGAVLNNQTFQASSIYSFFYYYLASFDPSFLFIKGDQLLVQTTGHHGMFLLASLPLFMIGIYQALKSRQNYFGFLTAAFLSSPLLFGYVGSAFFGHRLMFMVPFYCIFFTLGTLELMKNRHRLVKYLTIFIIVLVMINFFDFWHYYMFDYPKDTYHLFYHLEDVSKSYKELYKQAKDRKLTPYISAGVARLNGVDISDSELFARAIYFPKLPVVLDEQKESLPSGGILLSGQSSITNLKKINIGTSKYFLYTQP